MFSAYIDRFTDNDTALILVESLQKEFHVPSTSLPAGSTAGTWLIVDIQDDSVLSIQIDNEKTTTMQESIQERMKRLQSNKKSRFKRQ